MSKQTRPYIQELSLAFNPANRKKFLMKKDQDQEDNKVVVPLPGFSEAGADDGVWLVWRGGRP